jgi:hypothetical protein
MILVIDDVKEFPFPEDVEVIYARTMEKAYIEFINNEHLDELWLDHDMGTNEYGEEEDIRPLCLILAELGFNGTPRDVGKIIICSLNPVGIEWMQSTLEKYYTIERCTTIDEMFDIFSKKENK